MWVNLVRLYKDKSLERYIIKGECKTLSALLLYYFFHCPLEGLSNIAFQGLINENLRCCADSCHVIWIFLQLLLWCFPFMLPLLNIFISRESASSVSCVSHSEDPLVRIQHSYYLWGQKESFSECPIFIFPLRETSIL